MAFVWDGVFVGLTLTRQMLASMATAMLVFFAIGVWLPVPSVGNHAFDTNDTLWLAFNIYLLCRGILQAILFARRH